MTFSIVKVAIVIGVAATCTLEAVAQTLVLKQAGVVGTGCPPNTASASIKDGAVVLTGLKPTDFIVSAGTGVSPSQNRKNCEATLTVDVPAGWKYSFGDVAVPVQVQGAAGVQVSIDGKYHYQAEINDSAYADSILEGVSGTLTRANKFSPAMWSSCGGTSIVAVNTAFRLNPTNKQATASLKINGDVSTKIVWAKC